MFTPPLLPARARGAAAGAAIAAGSALVVCLPLAPGPGALAGLLLAAGSALASLLALWVAVPEAIVALVPTLAPSPIVAYTFAWEWALALLLLVTIVHGVRRNTAWVWSVSPMERWLLAFTAWALFTGFWCTTSLYYLLGMRRLVVGASVLWVALRLPHLAPRRWFNLGVVGAAGAIALAAILHSLSTGFSQMQALLHRTQVTDLGWGTANYVATLLLLCGPSLLRLALRGEPSERVLAGVAFALATVVEFIVASRAALALFIIATLLLLVHATRRYKLAVTLAGLGAVTGILASPLGVGVLSRIGSLRDLGSMTIRIWYFREGTQRLLEHLPWGMGLGQGYANADRLKGIDPHNYWLLVGGDLGLPGLVLWAGFLVTVVRAWLDVRHDEPSRETAFTILLTFAIGNLHALVEPTFQGGQYQLLFMWIVCGTLAYTRAGRARAAHSMSAGTTRAPLPEAAAAASGA